MPGTDYTITPLPIHFEVKQVNAEGYFLLEYVTDTERRILDRFGGWIFFEFGLEPAPKGKEGYLVDWQTYKTIEAWLLERKIKSITRFRSARGHPGADELFPAESKLVWLDGNWSIPDDHPFMVWTCSQLVETTTRFLKQAPAQED